MAAIFQNGRHQMTSSTVNKDQMCKTKVKMGSEPPFGLILKKNM